MGRGQMPAVKHPCTQCKEKHVKCDEERPKCRRCQSKDLPCARPVKKTVFKQGSIASFSRDQKWVSSEARHFRYHARSGLSARKPPSPEPSATPSRSPVTEAEVRSEKGEDRPADDTELPDQSPVPSLDNSTLDTDAEQPVPSDDVALVPDVAPSNTFIDEHFPRLQALDMSLDMQTPCLPSMGPVLSGLYSAKTPTDSLMSQDLSRYSLNIQPSASSFATAPTARRQRSWPLDNVQEACLLRYWIEDISHWFDLCDESRHFHLVVPMRAKEHPHLLNAVFAVAARHLSRLPQYKTPQGILYHGQLLPDLDEHSAVEYMLQCMPALRQFHDGRDDDYRDSIMATAVILRQLEEIDKEDDRDPFELTGGESSELYYGSVKKVNFLAIIDAVLRSALSQSVVLGHDGSLMQAAYWMALRQEIYHSFTRMEAPQIILAPEFWQNASPANKSVMHLVEVARWKWGESSAVEWARLWDQQEHLETSVLADIHPIFRKPADKSKGEIFPTVWYRSNIEVTSVQLSLLAKAVLVAENPQLKTSAASRSSWRQAENEVRILLIEQSGIALCNPASPPALVHAAFGIQVYGDYFTDHYERRAIRTVVEKYRDTHAWPVQQLLDMFR